MRRIVFVAVFVLLSCASSGGRYQQYETIEEQTPDKWFGGAERDFWADKSECETRSQTYKRRGWLFRETYTDGRRWLECMVGKGWNRPSFVLKQY